MNNRILYILLLAGAGALGVAAFFYFKKDDQVLRRLPYINAVEQSLKKQEDTLGRHVISDFALDGQDGKTVTRADFNNSIFVADFFFANCKSICPVMTSNLKKAYEKYKGRADVKFISHTVDPERDSVEALAAYAQRNDAEVAQWKFVTGDKKQLYQLARESYFISDTKGDGGHDDFVHSQNFALVDKNGHIRGIYDGTDSLEIVRLLTDMDVLLKEFGAAGAGK